jgi:hypothetical protein
MKSVKSRLTKEEYDSIANDLAVLVKIWYAVSKEDDEYFYIDKSRDTGDITKFFKTQTKRRNLMQFILRTNFKTTEEKMQANGWKVMESSLLPHAKHCEKKINNKNIRATYDVKGNRLYMAETIGFIKFDEIISLCNELKKIEG